MFLAIVIDLEPNLFRLGPFLITWHGVFSVLGILAAARLGRLWLHIAQRSYQARPPTLRGGTDPHFRTKCEQQHFAGCSAGPD